MELQTKYIDIRYFQIRAFLQIISKSSSYDKEFIKSLFLKESPNYQNTMDFLSEAGIITFDNDKMLLNSSISNQINKIMIDDDSLKNKLLEIIINNKKLFSQFIKEYLDNFTLIESLYTYKPSTEDKIKYSGIRNLLMELELIEFNNVSDTYYISEKYNHLLNDIIENRILSPEELTIILEKQKLLGTAAELAIIEYEKRRLSNYPELVKKIQHIALKDARAGYDILSFNLRDNSDEVIERYIEVKAVSGTNYKFYLTDNEIRKSIIYHEQYYLYLLPIICKNKFDIESVEIIYNPFEKIINNQEAWHKEVEKYIIMKK